MLGVIDGDTIVINNIRVRLAGIDAPELDHPWGQRSEWGLVQLCKGQTVTARIKPVTLAGLAGRAIQPGLHAAFPLRRNIRQDGKS